MRSSPLINILIRTLRSAGSLALRHFDRFQQLDVRTKRGNDLVSNADLDVERLLLEQLQRSFPQYGVLAEESGLTGDDRGLRWIVDPIDGTTNFVHGLPHFAISVALAEGEQVVAGAIYQPVLDELFHAERGGGAFLNNQRIRVSDHRGLSRTLLATGFRELFAASAGVRRAGSAALDLAYTAAGRYDGFWELKLSPWDVAAGALLVQEAGGWVTDFRGEKDYMKSGNMLAAPPAVHEKMLEKIREAGLDQID